jgi:hypothetical protein
MGRMVMKKLKPLDLTGASIGVAESIVLPPSKTVFLKLEKRKG